MAYEAGKGSDRRATEVPEEQAAANWTATFGETWLQRKARLEREALLDTNNNQDILSTEDCVLDALESLKDGD